MEASVNEIERQSVMEPMLYEESMKKKEKLILKLKTGFPFVYALVHSILVLGLMLKPLLFNQDHSMIKFKNVYYFTIIEPIMHVLIATYFIITEILTLILTNRLNYKLYIVIMVLHYIGAVVSIIATIIPFCHSYFPFKTPFLYAIVGILSLSFAIILQLSLIKNKVLNNFCSAQQQNDELTSKNLRIGTIQSISSPTILNEMFDQEGKGIKGEYCGWYLCDGRNGTPDLRFQYTNISGLQAFKTHSQSPPNNNPIIAYIIYFNPNNK